MLYLIPYLPKGSEVLKILSRIKIEPMANIILPKGFEKGEIEKDLKERGKVIELNPSSPAPALIEYLYPLISEDTIVISGPLSLYAYIAYLISESVGAVAIIGENMWKIPKISDPGSNTFKVLKYLCLKGGACITEIERGSGLRRASVEKVLEKLEAEGIIGSKREGRRRIIYFKR